MKKNKNSRIEPPTKFSGTENTNSLKMDRRSFLKTGVSAAALIATASAASPQQTFPPPGPTPQQFVPGEIVEPGQKRLVPINVNGKDYVVQVEMRDMLVNVLREQLGLIGTKRPCNRMECGGCTVLIDGERYYSCTYPITHAIGKKILTVEGRETDPVLKTVQDAWQEMDASQCGYCQAGQIMSATALLKSNPNPEVDEIKIGMSGNLCRCGTYYNIIEAIQLASKKLRGLA